MIVEDLSNVRNNNFFAIIIGSGPAGVTAAIQAAKLQKKVCIVEKNPENSAANAKLGFYLKKYFR